MAEKSWRDALPETLRDDASLKDIADVVTLAKNFIETKAFVGSSIRPVGPDAGDADKQAFYAKLQKAAPHLIPFADDEASQNVIWGKLGRPAKAEEYEFKAPDGVNIPLEGLRATAMAAGMTKKQFQKLAEGAVTAVQGQTNEAAADKTKLKTEWGQAYEQKLKSAAAVAGKLDVAKEVIAEILTGNLNSTQLKLWDKIATAMGSGERSEIAAQTGGNGSPKLTPAEAKKQFAELQSNPDYMNPRSPNQKILIAKSLELMDAINAGS